MLLDTTAAPESWPCELCGKPSRQRVHPGCADHVDDNLAALPGLYRRLEDALAPGSPSPKYGTTSASRTAPLPVSLPALDLRARGGIEGVVTTWERAVREDLGWAPPPFRGSIEQTIAGAVDFLQRNLPWMCDQHEAVRDFAHDVARLRRECEAVVTGERPERRVTVQCACGQPLRITLSTPGKRCGCGAQYGWQELRELPLAQRAAA